MKDKFSKDNGFKGILLTLTFLLLFVTVSSQIVLAQESQKYTADQLDQIVAPIALYPDDLIAHILPASTLPLEVVQAARYLEQKGGKVTELPENEWDPSVKALLMFPDVLEMMNKNLEWTDALGGAVVAQQNDVMNSIQRIRKANYDAGNLNNMEHQKVEVQKDNIIIVPSNPQVIYVPQYNPQVVVQPDPGAVIFSFAAGMAVSSWFRYRTCDWYRHGFVVHPTYISHYRYPPGYRRPPQGGGYWRPTPYSKNYYNKRVGNRTNIRYGNTYINVNKNRPVSKPGSKPIVKPGTGKPTKLPTKTTNQPSKMPTVKKPTGTNKSPFGNVQNRSNVNRNSNRGSSSRTRTRSHSRPSRRRR